MNKIENKIARVKKKYEVARTNYAVSSEKRKDCIKKMKELGVTPKTIKAQIKKMEEDLKSDEQLLDTKLDTIDEAIG